MLALCFVCVLFVLCVVVAFVGLFVVCFVVIVVDGVLFVAFFVKKQGLVALSPPRFGAIGIVVVVLLLFTMCMVFVCCLFCLLFV